MYNLEMLWIKNEKTVLTYANRYVMGKSNDKNNLTTSIIVLSLFENTRKGRGPIFRIFMLENIYYFFF